MLYKKYEDYYQLFLTDFISYLRGTSIESWCTDVVRTQNNKNCLFGHLSNFCLHACHDDISEDFDWFEFYVATTYMIYPVNDGKNKKYQHDNCRDRCIAYLQNILNGSELNTIELMKSYD